VVVETHPSPRDLLVSLL